MNELAQKKKECWLFLSVLISFSYNYSLAKEDNSGFLFNRITGQTKYVRNFAVSKDERKVSGQECNGNKYKENLKDVEFVINRNICVQQNISDLISFVQEVKAAASATNSLEEINIVIPASINYLEAKKLVGSELGELPGSITQGSTFSMTLVPKKADDKKEKTHSDILNNLKKNQDLNWDYVFIGGK